MQVPEQSPQSPAKAPRESESRPLPPELQNGQHKLIVERLSRSNYVGFLLAAGCVAAAVMIRYALDRWVDNEAPLLPFVLAVMIAALCGGLRPGVFATVLGGAVGVHLFIEPPNTSWVQDVSKPLWFLVFLVIGATISWLFESLHSARRRAEAVAAIILAQKQHLRGRLTPGGRAMNASSARSWNRPSRSCSTPMTGKYFA